MCPLYLLKSSHDWGAVGTVNFAFSKKFGWRNRNIVCDRIGQREGSISYDAGEVTISFRACQSETVLPSLPWIVALSPSPLHGLIRRLRTLVGVVHPHLFATTPRSSQPPSCRRNMPCRLNSPCRSLALPRLLASPPP
jgi:hypothetical protein